MGRNIRRKSHRQAVNEGQFETRIVADTIEFKALKPAWNELAEQTGERSVFLTFEWFDAAWAWAQQNSDLHIIIVERRGKTAAICPFVIRTSAIGLVQARSLEFLTVPDTQLCDILTNYRSEPEVFDAIAKALADKRCDWDRLCLRYLDKTSVTFDLLSRSLRKVCYKIQSLSDSENPQIETTSGWSQYYANRSRRLRKGNRHIANKLKKLGTRIEIQWCHGDAASCDEASVFLGKAKSVSERSYKKELGLSLVNRGPAEFISLLTKHARNRGWLSIWLLCLDGEVAASEYQLIFHGDVHALRADVDPRFKSLGVGTYLSQKLLERLFADPDTKCYLMGPGNNPYKRRWYESARPLYKIVGYRSSARGLFFALATQAWHRIHQYGSTEDGD
jgi:ribosomal protein S18 acetylase RimI-like enzyme